MVAVPCDSSRRKSFLTDCQTGNRHVSADNELRSMIMQIEAQHSGMRAPATQVSSQNREMAASTFGSPDFSERRRRRIAVFRRFIALFVVLLVIHSNALSETAHNQQGHPSFDEAQQAVANGDYAHAIDIYQNLLKRRPRSAPLYLALGIAEFQKGDYLSATSALKRAIVLQPDFQVAKAFLGLSESAMGDIHDCIPLLQAAFAADDAMTPNGLKRMIGLHLAKAYTDMGQWNDAEGVYLSLLKKYPNDPRVLYDDFWFNMTRSRRLMRTLLRDDPHSYLTHEMLGHLLAENQNYPAAAKQFRLALQENPTALGLHYELGNALMAMSPDDKSASAEYEEELRLHPFHVASYCRLAELAYRRQQMEASWRLYSKALHVDPRDSDALVGLAEICMARKQPADALRYCQKAVDVNPASPAAHYVLAQIYRELGRADEAKIQMQRFQKLKSENDAETEYMSGMRIAVPEKH